MMADDYGSPCSTATLGYPDEQDSDAQSSRSSCTIPDAGRHEAVVEVEEETLCQAED